MPLTLHFHPLSSFSQKVLVALYELGAPFEPHIVDLGNEAARAAFTQLWPIGKIPVLEDSARRQVIPESSIIIEYLARHQPGRTALLPVDPDRALEVRLADRFYDFNIELPMQRIVFDRLRPPGQRDPLGVEQARAQLRMALGVVDAQMAERRWAAGADFSMADCAAAPALYYADFVLPFAAQFQHAAAYLERLRQRPSYARALAEAEPYFHLLPK